eukprot:SAG25_NODE_862_length_5023_cov_2.854010_6_plen_115_part_00
MMRWTSSWLLLASWLLLWLVTAQAQCYGGNGDHGLTTRGAGQAIRFRRHDSGYSADSNCWYRVQCTAANTRAEAVINSLDLESNHDFLYFCTGSSSVILLYISDSNTFAFLGCV